MARRPDYIVCVFEDNRFSYCGRDISMEFHFKSPYHANANEEQEGRLVTCPQCKLIMSGNEKAASK